ncbi:Fur-regulated basic protein FbpA [Rossellomorea vietnamensis]|uniref:Fur-regulated basic protein FbpA n=1 Tax=Rossellomorea vietnamensis TaxID=218284 RepID=A0A5D4ME33_9BACI|nr:MULTISPECIES: Fur-regulated basic protein FbpA [Bacillaceae]TYR99583.1 Fur-regulated basic protein FbpA [Rossellomorea vietnamensis]
MQQRKLSSTEDFYIKQLLRIGIYKVSDKQLYELSKNELHEEYLAHYVEKSITKVLGDNEMNTQRFV